MQSRAHTIAALVFSLLLGGSDLLYAAAEDAAANDEQTAEEMLAAEAALEAQEAEQAQPGEDTETTDASAPPARSTAGATDDDFVPTIQISEDLSVSFPVDI